MAFFIPRWEKYTEACAPENPEIDWGNEINDELKSFYIFRKDLYGTNLATGEIDQVTEVGTGINWADDGSYVETKNSASNYISMPHGISTVGGFSGFVAENKIAGSVAWSLLRTSTSQWTGIYSDGAALKTTSGNSFDGVAALAGTGDIPSYAYSYEPGDLRAVSGGGLAIDDSFTAFPSTQYKVFLGLSARSTKDNPSQTRFRHLGFYDRVLDDEVKLELHMNPYQGLKERRGYWPVAKAAGSAPIMASALRGA